MKTVQQLDKLQLCCQKHFKDLFQNKTCIRVFSIVTGSVEIWGGNGDRDTESVVYITPENWLLSEQTSEYGMYPGKNEVKFKKEATSEDVLSLLVDSQNSYAISQLEAFYDEISLKYPEDFI